jgi:nucleoside-diphosphate-sugar epimerase
MAYTLLTGSTGFLGRYLMKDCLLAGVPLVVLIRPNKFETGQQRLEAVLQYWERRLERSLPRPVIVAGDVRQPDCGLDASSLRWLSDHCDSIVHSAASMNFHAKQPDGEPFFSNVAGTTHLLEVCRAVGIRHFHQVSTAYICGLREGQVLESELDLGQSMGNDYERSKMAAEKLIRAASFLESATFYRPASVLGDSENGYTTNFHGFYAPLQVLYSMLKGLMALGETGRQLGDDAMRRTGFMSRLNLTGAEGKNLVPVDWVSAVLTHVLLHPELHGRTYHLTPRVRTTVQLVGDVFEEVLREYGGIPLDAPVARLPIPDEERDASEKYFREEMSTYDSHWRDDPIFDYTNTQQAAPHLPCPVADREMLLRAARFAIQTNFGWPRPKPVQLDFDASRGLQQWVRADDQTERDDLPRLALDVTGAGGGQWSLAVNGTTPLSAATGLNSNCRTAYRLNSQTFRALSERQLTVEQAVYGGALVIEGVDAGASTTIDILRRIVVDGSV